jgi:hypothetical protein
MYDSPEHDVAGECISILEAARASDNPLQVATECLSKFEKTVKTNSKSDLISQVYSSVLAIPHTDYEYEEDEEY